MAGRDSPAGMPESPYDEGDAVYPCKGCGEILEEGKAFELAGNRWHIDCFRCNTCGTLLDSDANLLLLGDGSLICNNCTYSCNACGNKIEDLAILTGDQAFCAACFRCRNCKRKIENLRYARTSQGIFCMSCHESLMARRRKKSKKSTTPSSANSTAPVVLDKSLPALPPSAVPTTSVETPDTESSSERGPKSDNSRLRGDHGDVIKREPSPLSAESKRDDVTLPASTYKEHVRKSSMSSNEDHDDESRGFLPMAFDPSPAQYPSASTKGTESVKARETQPRDYFTNTKSNRDRLREGGSRSRDATPERDATTGAIRSSSHIAGQEKGRPNIMRKDTSGQSTPISGSAVTSPNTATAADKAGDKQERPRPQQQPTTSFNLGTGDGFKLQDAPKSRKNSVRKSDSRLSDHEVRPTTNRSVSQTRSAVADHSISKSIGTPDSGYNPFDDPKLRDNGSTRHPARGDSLTSSARKPLPTAADRSDSDAHLPIASHGHNRSGSSASIPSQFVDAPSYPSRINGSVDSPSRPHLEIPPRAAGRSAPSKSVANDDFISPRAPPAPPPAGHDRLRNASVTSFEGGESLSPLRSHFKKPSLGGDFNMEDEMSRIMSGQRKDSNAEASSPSAPSMLRRVSNAVRHGRSFSDRGIPSSARTPTGSQLEISSPTLIPSGPVSPSVREDVAVLRTHLRRAQQKIAELESDKVALEEKVNGSSDIKQVNTELREKRSTMAFLDTQREMVVRELEVMTEHLTKAKESNQPLDISVLKSDVLQDFAHSLRKLKDTLGAQIEDLVHRRNELTDEISNLIQVKDKGLQEFESLSSKNNQLNDLNSQLVQNIQDMYKANKIPNGNVHLLNGLGISANNNRSTDQASDPRSGSMTQIDSPTPLTEPSEVEHAELLNQPQPQVVNIRKGRFNWKRVGKDVAKNTTKGIKGAFARDENGVSISGPTPIQISGPNSENSSMKGSFFSSSTSSHQKGSSNLKPGQLGALHKNSSNSNLGSQSTVVVNDPSVLFGSDLTARCDYEKRVLPAVVTRCIEEVESRGMTQEGVYRKSGGSGQVKSIQLGFEKEGPGFDISDPDLDIHAVTSCLKQYFRKLPNPLITYEVYDSMLEAAGLEGREDKVMGLRMAVRNLPESHRDVLEFLMGHLGRVVEKEAENLMTPLNLSVVFAPTIMRPLTIEREMTDMQAQREVVRALLDQRVAIFDS